MSASACSRSVPDLTVSDVWLKVAVWSTWRKKCSRKAT